MKYTYTDALGSKASLRLRDVVVIEDPVFQTDRVLEFTNLFCTLGENLIARVFGPPTNGSSDETNEVEECLARGMSLMRSSRMGDAIECFRDVLAKEPDNRDALLYTGVALGHDGEYERALSFFERAEGLTEAVTRRTVAEMDTYLTGGRVDSPPSIDRGMAVFGCRDGWVYALRASDGEEVWRFRAAPVDLRLVDNDRIESV